MLRRQAKHDVGNFVTDREPLTLCPVVGVGADEMLAIVLETISRFVRSEIGLWPDNCSGFPSVDLDSNGKVTGCTFRTNSLALRTARNSSIAIFFLQDSSDTFDQSRVIRSTRTAIGYACRGRELFDGNRCVAERVRTNPGSTSGCSAR